MFYHHYGLIEELGSSSPPFVNSKRVVQSKTPDESGWIGKPVGIAAVLLAALVTTPTFFLHQTRSVVSAETAVWTGEPSPIPSVLLQLPAQPAFSVKGTKQFNLVPDAFWQGAPQPSALLQIRSVPAFTIKGTRQLNFSPEPVWVGSPEPIPAALLQLPAQTPFTVKGTREVNLVPEPGWLGEPAATPPALLALITVPNYPLRGTRQFVYLDQTPNFLSIALTVPLTPQAVLPFYNVRRTEHVPEPGWVGTPKPIPAVTFAPPPVVLPFANSPWKGPIAAPDWVDGGGAVPQVLLQFPAQPSFTVKGTRQFNHVPEPAWTGEAIPVSIIYTLPPAVVLPFANRPWQGPIAAPDWVKGGGAVSPVQLQLPAQPPFTVRGTRQLNSVPDTVWTGAPTAPPLNLLAVQTAQPFANPRRFDFDSTPPRALASQPVPQVLLRLNPAVRAVRLVNEPIYLLEIQVCDPNSLVVSTKYFSSRTKPTRRDDTPAETIYDGRMVNAGFLSRSLFDNGGLPATIGGASSNRGYFVLNNADGALNYLFDYGIGGRPFTLKVLADIDDNVTSATTIFIGVMRGVASDDLRNSLQIRIRDKLELLDVQLLTNVYGGTTTGAGPTADGDATLLNVAKPKAFGDVLKFTPKCANTFDLIYQVSDGAVSLINVYDGGVQLSRDADYATLALLQAAVIPAGKFSTCLAHGYFRLASAPAKQITSDTQAQSVTWASNEDLYEPGPLAKAVMLSAGISSGDIDSSFDNLMTTSGSGSYRCGVYVQDTSTTILDAVSKILGSVGAAVTSTADDKFKAVVLCPLPLPVNVSVANSLTLPPGSPVDTFTIDDIGKDASFQLFATRSTEGDGVPVWWVNVNYSPYLTTQSRGEIAGSVNDADALDLSKQYRTTVDFDSAVKTVHPLAQTLTFDTQLTRLPGVNAEAARQLKLYKTRRNYVTLTLSLDRVDRVQVIDLGNEVALTFAELGWSSKSFYVVGRTDQFAERQVKLTLFG